MSMQAATLIRCKREGGQFGYRQLRDIARGIGSGHWSEGQVGAFAMAVAWRGMSIDECRHFTSALRDSGRQLRWSHLPGPVLDKHSTGGVGDCVSLLLAPLLAACGGYVPMISGRGLGHTGGTLDKLESLRGYDVQPSTAVLRKVVTEVGCAIVGQNDDLVPADRRLYAVRDVTATVDVPDLMVASILSKKFAGGAQALVLDVKTGSGAQLPDTAAARALADRLLAVAKGSGIETRVALTDMGQVPGSTAGNALEVRTVLELLRGDGGCPRLLDLTLALAKKLLQLGGLARDISEAETQLRRALASGAAAERFARMVAALGGPHDVLERPDFHLPQAPVQQAVLSPAAGHVAAVDVKALGQVIVDLGGGRRHAGQVLDHAVGLAGISARGDRIEAGQPLACIHARSKADAERVCPIVRQAFAIGASAPPPEALLHWHMSEERPA